MQLVRRTLLCGGFAFGAAGFASAKEPESVPQPLQDEPSRAELFAKVEAAAANDDPATTQSGTQYFNLYGPFLFPNDAIYDVVEQKERANSLFGIDISHYTPNTFPIEDLYRRQVRFVYMKTTQGTGYFDPKFASFYKRVQDLPAGRKIHPGAYHFLSSTESGAAQARNFLKVLSANGALPDGRLRATDMPPVVDLEWDIAVKNGPDRWSGKPAKEILRETKAFLDEVQRGAGRKPMIYTARAWWRERIGTDDLGPLAGYPLWLADYSRTSRASEKPPGLAGAPWTLWQFTEKATMALGFSGGFDANVYKGSTDEFYTALGVARFA
jgi:lysozyme